MIANKLIDDLIKYSPKNKINEAHIEKVSKSIKFNLGSQSEVLLINKNQKTSRSPRAFSDGEFLSVSYEDLRLLPFDNCLFQITDDRGKEHFIHVIKDSYLDYELGIYPHKSIPNKEGVLTQKGYTLPIQYFLLSLFGKDNSLAEISTTPIYYPFVDDELMTPKELAEKESKTAYRLIACALKVMACSNVITIENTPSKLKKSRVKNGKTPLFTYKTLHIKTEERTKNKHSSGGTHATPRVHLRRGHIRKLSESKWTWVSPCVVGDPVKGTVKKDYALK